MPIYSVEHRGCDAPTKGLYVVEAESPADAVAKTRTSGCPKAWHTTRVSLAPQEQRRMSRHISFCRHGIEGYCPYCIEVEGGK